MLIGTGYSQPALLRLPASSPAFSEGVRWYQLRSIASFSRAPTNT
jgi:hypothetical protein